VNPDQARGSLRHASAALVADMDAAEPVGRAPTRWTPVLVRPDSGGCARIGVWAAVSESPRDVEDKWPSVEGANTLDRISFAGQFWGYVLDLPFVRNHQASVQFVANGFESPLAGPLESLGFGHSRSRF